MERGDSDLGFHSEEEKDSGDDMSHGQNDRSDTAGDSGSDEEVPSSLESSHEGGESSTSLSPVPKRKDSSLQKLASSAAVRR